MRKHPEGLKVPELRRLLLRAGYPGVLERDIEEMARLPDFHWLPGGLVALRGMELEGEKPEEAPEPTEESEPSTLRDLPNLHAYILFDVETNGLDPQTADFFQLSAIKVVGRRPIATFDRYARVPMSTFTQAQRVRLHVDELGLEEKIARAGTQGEAVEAFQDFAGSLPLVAHNGRFDLGFLRKHAPDLSNPLVDALELFCLAFPTEPSHRLDHLARRFGLVEGGSRWPEVVALDQALGISSGLGVLPRNWFHTALYDCLILHILLCEALAALRRLGPGLKARLRSLSPALGDLVKAPEGPFLPLSGLADLVALREWRSRVPSERATPEPRLRFDEETVESVYEMVLAYHGWQPRQAQREMLSHVVQTFAQRATAMIEAPTGTGKTLAYLLPALVLARARGVQVLVSTSTRGLQDQLVRDLEERVRPAVPFAFRFAVLKGQANYLCLYKLGDRVLEALDPEASAEVPFEERLALLYLLRYAEESPDGDLEGVSFWLQQRLPILRFLRGEVASERWSCSPACQYYRFCFHARAKALSDTTDLVLVNHALLLTREWAEGRLGFLILDEAHHLEDAATSALTLEASRTTLETLLMRLLDLSGKQGALIRARRWISQGQDIQRAMGAVRRLRKQVARFGGYLRDFLAQQGVRFHPRYGATWRMRTAPHRTHALWWEPVGQALEEMCEELVTVAGALERIAADLMGRYPLVDRAVAIARDLEAIRAQLVGDSGQVELLRTIPLVGYDPTAWVHWIELTVRGRPVEDTEEVRPEHIEWAFKRAPVRVADALTEKVFQCKTAAILTSATLTVAESGFGFFLDRLGLSERVAPHHLVQLPKEFRYEEQVLLALPAYLRASARYGEIQRFQEEMARELECLLRFTEGRALVLHTARSRMEYVAQRLEKTLTHLPIYWQREGTAASLLKEEFQAREESVLLGVRTFWEGIDVPGPSLSYLVVEKLPFPVPTDPVVEARREEVRARGGNEWMDYLVPLAALAFKQGFGRLMRQHEDRGVVLFLDKRLRTDALYREVILRSLPGYKRPDALLEAEEERLSLYREIGRHMQPVFPWDWEERLERFPCIREEALPEMERLLEDHGLPERISWDEYPHYRAHLWAVAKELVPGFVDFRPEQDEAMRAILSGADVLIVLPTGSGKSLTFQLPALLRDGVTLVFSPLIALMRDQVDRLRGAGLTRVDYIVNGQSGAHRDEVYRRLARGELRLVYIAPERIRDPALAEALRHAKVVQVVVDEAHCVHMWGPSFRPDFLKIPDLFGTGRPPFTALTATATAETRQAIAEGLKLRSDFLLVTKSVDRPELKFLVYGPHTASERITSKRDKLRVLLKILRAAQRRGETAIVYTATVWEAEHLARVLELHGFAVRAYHGRMSAQTRAEVEELFREDIVKIVVATKAFGMGIDKADVRYVIHYDIPGDLESYFQEAGRAGRDGRTAYSVLLYHPGDLRTQRYFIQRAFPGVPELRSLFQTVWTRAESLEGALLPARPEDLAFESGLEVEQLDVALHLLEELGLVRRLNDFTLQASVLLNRSPSWLQEQLPPDQGSLLFRLATNQWVSHTHSTSLDLLEAAMILGVSPLQIDGLLTHLSTRGWAVYRPWERGYALQVLGRPVDEAVASLERLDEGRLRHRLQADLKRMTRYVEQLGPGDCRRAHILKHFGEAVHERPSPCCDLCDPQMDVPWREVSSEDVVALSVGVDPAYVILRAVDWNERSSREGGYSPYSASTLVQILVGNAYGAVRAEREPDRRTQRLKRLRASPFYGVLQGMKGGAKAVARVLQRLHEQGYVALSLEELSVGGRRVEYRAPRLTEKGALQVRSGKYLSQ
ncbi:MAG: RecQ family ATP-dependent DNA helicase [Anaerolineae bacterium]